MNRHATGRRLIAGSAAIGELGPFRMHLLLPALPPVAADFSASASTVQLLISLPLLAIAFGNLTVAPLSDRFGRRSVIIGGLCLFMIGSLGGLLAPSLDTLLAARIVQQDDPLAGVIDPGLTTIHYPMAQMGERAFELVRSLRESPPRTAPREVLETPLIVRRSSDPKCPLFAHSSLTSSLTRTA